MCVSAHIYWLLCLDIDFFALAIFFMLNTTVITSSTHCVSRVVKKRNAERERDRENMSDNDSEKVHCSISFCAVD